MQTRPLRGRINEHIPPYRTQPGTRWLRPNLPGDGLPYPETNHARHLCPIGNQFVMADKIASAPFRAGCRPLRCLQWLPVERPRRQHGSRSGMNTGSSATLPVIGTLDGWPILSDRPFQLRLDVSGKSL